MNIIFSSEAKFIFGIFGIILGFIGYYPYFRDIYRWKTKPHAFSWVIWWVLTAIGFAIQVYEKWWLWAWVLGTTSIICFIVAWIGFYQKQVKYKSMDWVVLFVAFLSIIPWYFTKNPMFSVIIITFIDFLGFLPTYRKIYFHPESETLSAWYMMDVKILLWILALDIFTFNSIFYPVVVFFLNVFAIILIHIKK